MKNSLAHLPGYKQEEIRKISGIIQEVVSPEKIILFGSYAKGNWVEDRYQENGIRYEYISDYDFLVITKDNPEKDYLLADKIVNRARHITSIEVNLIIHEMGYVNEGLEIGQYFFTEIIKEGVLLFDTGKTDFAGARELSWEEQKEISQRYFDKWFINADEFLETAQYLYSKKIFKKSAFNLHQAAESFYNTILLVFTGYKPKTHNLEKLRQYAKPYSKELMEVFPDSTENKQEGHLFNLLKRGYIDARYKDDYEISEGELELLFSKIEKMKRVIWAASQERLKSNTK